MNRLVPRSVDRARVERALARAPVVLLVGARQVGKSTLARAVAADRSATLFDLERPSHAERLREPMLALERLRGLVVIDEAQHAPGLFPILRVLADRPERPATFLILGSASPDLVGLTAESLAGRVEILHLGGLLFADVGADNLDRLWLHGGLPESFIRNDGDSAAWRESYVASFLERDLAQLGSRVPAAQMRRFWTMLAHHHGQTWNASGIGRALGVSHMASRRYLDALTDALVVRQLLPWFENVGKRVVRSPKVYVRDTGVLHTLLGLATLDDVHNHPKVGASWEGLIIEQIASALDPLPLYFWGTQSGAELDLMVMARGRRIGVEIKRADAPRMTRSLGVVLRDLGLDHVYVVSPGSERYLLAEHIEVVSAADIVSLLEAAVH